MTRFLTLLAILCAMTLLIPLAPVIAVSRQAGLIPHLFYPLAHASLIHWAFNAYAILTLHAAASPRSLTTAYVLAVILAAVLPPDTPTLGLSVISFFLIGTILTRLCRLRPLTFIQLIIFVAVSFFIPGIAALYHAVMLALGLVCRFCSDIIDDIASFDTKRQ